MLFIVSMPCAKMLSLTLMILHGGQGSLKWCQAPVSLGNAKSGGDSRLGHVRITLVIGISSSKKEKRLSKCTSIVLKGLPTLNK